MNLIKKIAVSLLLIPLSLGICKTSYGADEISQNALESPQAGYYFPNDILDRSLSKYPDQRFNISRTPLANRVILESNSPYATEKDASTMAIMIANASTSGTSPQGASNYKDGYAFTNWQYVDTMIYWGGSAGEGIIVTPAADFVDSSHKNGVPVQGTVFFPPKAYGGREDRVKDFLIKDSNGNFPIADKLIEIAETLGFDGRFINQETSFGYNNPSIGPLFEEFLDYYNKKTEGMNLTLTWYDAMIRSGSVAWQGALNDQNKMFYQEGDKKRSDEVFVDFRWNSNSAISSRNKALELKRNPYELYFGFDVQGDNLYRYINATRATGTLQSLTQNNKLLVSPGLYTPDSVMRTVANKSGEEFWEEVWKNEQLLWINDTGNLNIAPTYAWRGISTYIAPRSPITSFPFETSFDMGAGENLYQKGEIIREGSYYNRSMQDVMPTYRFDIVNNGGNNLDASLDVIDVYNGGSSLKVFGDMVRDVSTELLLYGSDARINDGFARVIKNGNADINLLLQFEDGKKVSIKGEENSGNWQEVIYDLSDYVGDTVRKFGIEIIPREDFNGKINIGKLQIGNLDTKEIYVRNPEITEYSINEETTANINLQFELSEDTGANIYYLDINNEKVFIKYVKNNNAFIENLRRLSDENSNITLIIAPVNSNGDEESEKEVSIVFNFGELKAPKANFIVDKTFAKVGEIITLKEDDSISTSEYLWEVPGASIPYLEGREVEVVFDKPGLYTVRHIARNAAGENIIEKINLITIYENLNVDLRNIAPLSIKTTASAYVNSNESPIRAIDENIRTKWCDNSSDIPWIMLEFDKPYTITGFEIYHAEAGGEGANMNTRDYYIEVSEDGVNFTKIIDVKDNKDGITSHSTLTKAKFVRATLLRAEQNGSVARIYEFKIFGFEGDMPEVVPYSKEISEIRDTYFDTRISEEERTNYTTESLSLYDELSLRAKEILDSNSFDLEKDSTLATDLKEAYENLEIKENEEEVNFESLTYLIDQSINIIDMEDRFTENSYQRFLDNYNEAANLFEIDADQEMINEAYKKLLASLISLREVNNKNINGNKNELDKLIKEVENLDRKLFTENSLIDLDDTLISAKNAYKSKNLTLNELEDNYYNLIKAILDLELKEEGLNKSALEIVTKYGKSTPEAKKYVKDILKSRDITQSVIDNALSYYILESFNR